MKVELSQSEINHVLDLIWMNECEGTHRGSQKYWVKRNKSIKAKLINSKQP